MLKRRGESRVVVMPPGVSLLYSYETAVAAQVNGIVYYSSTFHSPTTARHIRRWLADIYKYDRKGYRGREGMPQREFEVFINKFYRGARINGNNI